MTDQRICAYALKLQLTCGANVVPMTPKCPADAGRGVFRQLRHNVRVRAQGERDHVDALVLGDSPIVVRTIGGSTNVLDDTRLDNVAADLRAEIREHLCAGEGYSAQHRERMRQLNAQERAARNTPAGYWIAEAVPAAAEHAHTRHWRTHEVDHAILMTDGVSRAVKLFGRYATWCDALEAAQQLGPQHICQAVRDAEASDRNGQRWQRSKPLDDQAAVLVDFSPPPPSRGTGTMGSTSRGR